MIKTSFIALFVLYAMISEGQNQKTSNSIELIVGLQNTNAKYANGVSVSLPNGTTEDQVSDLQWYLQGRKTFKSRSKWFMEPGISLGSYSYTNKYKYPDSYSLPKINSIRHKYLFTSIDYRILFKAIGTDKFQIYPYGALSINILLDSKVKFNSEANGQAITSYANWTNKESRVNPGYELGTKFYLLSNKHNPISFTINYNHFLKEQYNAGPGKLIYAFRFGIGYTI